MDVMRAGSSSGVVRRALAIAAAFPALSTLAAPLAEADGYRGIWYFNQPSKDEYRYKYSGGMATYPQQHIPIAVYSKEAEKTFFVYGGTTARKAGDKQELLHMVSYFDHRTGTVPRPRILLNKRTDDAHDNPVLALDGAGHLWIFSPSHGTGRPSYIHRSARPHDISEFDLIVTTNFSYPQPWYLPEHGFVFLHTRYRTARETGAQRRLFWQASRTGQEWNPAELLARIEMGDYQISWPNGARLGTAFDFHPPPLGLNARSSIFYLESRDGGKSWRTAAGTPITTPLTNAGNPALAYDSRADGLLVYLKDLNYDRNGNPVILFLTSKGFESGPANAPRTWQTLHWSGEKWIRRPVTTSQSNYDHGSLYIEEDGAWRIIAPTDPGRQPYNPGGEMVMWTSPDSGQTWQKLRQLTRNSSRNHTYARRPLNTHPQFYAVWADGHARQPSESYLYYTTRSGETVRRLPAQMPAATAVPEALTP